MAQPRGAQSKCTHVDKPGNVDVHNAEACGIVQLAGGVPVRRDLLSVASTCVHAVCTAELSSQAQLICRVTKEAHPWQRATRRQ